MKSSPRVFALAMMNASLDDEEIIPYLDNLKATGYEGVCLHPRDGLRVPYNTRAYWEKINHILTLSRERGLDIWHYDEFPFPSGMAGGLIPADDPAVCVRALQFEILDATPNRDGVIEVGPESLLALLRFRVNERGEKENLRDVTADCGAYLDTFVWGEWHNKFYTGTFHVHEELHERGVTDRYTRKYLPDAPLAPDEKLLAVKIVTPRGRAGLPGRVDITRPEVTDKFLHEIYARFSKLSQQQGLTSTPVFQDEVTLAVAWPWNAEIETRLRPLWNENFAVNFAALHAPNVAGWETVRSQYRAACHDAFEKNWFERVRNYCAANNLQMTGHLAGEESLIGHCQLLGDAFKNLRHFDIPGFDIISSTIPDDLNRSSALGIKVVQSVAWMEGRKPTMVEVFGAHGFHNDLQRNRSVLAWLAVHDLTRVFDHSAYLSTKSLRKYDAPPLHNRFNPLDVGRKDLWEWHNWFADLMEEYPFDPKTLILFPIESLARYSTLEEELWRKEVSLLETWFHYAFAHSLDAVLLPSHRLHEVEATDNGFRFDNHDFENFIVPPFLSFARIVWEKVLPLQAHSHFSWCVSNREKQVTVFGEDGSSEECAIAAARVFPCTEDELLQRRATWFDEVLASPLMSIESERTIIKTQRQNAQGERLLVVINPHDDAIEIGGLPVDSEKVAQPPHHVGAREYSGGGSTTLPPREILILKETAAAKASTKSASTPAREQIEATVASIHFSAPNMLSLKSGSTQLEGYRARNFAPTPVSSLWTMPLKYADTDSVFAPPYSREVLAKPLILQTTFPLVLEEAFSDLQLLLDDESAPENLQVFFDDTLLEKTYADVFDMKNAVYQVPAPLLRCGAHRLRLEGVVSCGAQGVLERPIIIGSFLARLEDPQSTPRLRAMPQNTQTWNEKNWTELGIPEGYGPLEYEFVYELTPAQAAQKWWLQLSQCIGVAEVWINDSAQGRLSWEPRKLNARDLKAGRNNVRVRLHGSWNNLFSRLNVLQNGLSASPVLVSEALE